MAKRFIRTLKKQCLWALLYEGINDLRQHMATFTKAYNNDWPVERLGDRTPREAFIEATALVAA